MYWYQYRIILFLKVYGPNVWWDSNPIPDHIYDYKMAQNKLKPSEPRLWLVESSLGF